MVNCPWAMGESPGRWIPKGELQGTTLPAVEVLQPSCGYPPSRRWIFNICFRAASPDWTMQCPISPFHKGQPAKKGVLRCHSSSSSAPVPSLPGVDQHHAPKSHAKGEGRRRKKKLASLQPGKFTKLFGLLDWLQRLPTLLEKSFCFYSQCCFSLLASPGWTFTKT